MDCFANQLNSDIPPQKLYFRGNRLAQIYHARLRTCCSTLRLHLYSKNIIENCLCNCGEIEEPSTFSLSCNQYNLIRRDMFTCISAICNPNLNILLHGNECISEEQNLNIFMDTPARSHTFVEIDHEIISTVILLPSTGSFKKGCCQLQAKVCARSTG